MPKTGVDYATDNITVYRYCPYFCRYCWAWRLPLFAKRISKGKYDPIEEAKKYARMKMKRVIVVSFTSDPYPPQEFEEMRTRRVLEVLAKTHHRVMVLTKNPNCRDLDLFLEAEDFWLGTTIVTLDEDKAKHWEPKAPSPRWRTTVLEFAYKRGVKTWMSIEPIIPGTTYPEEIIRQTIDYVNWYVLGAFNYTRQLGLSITKQQLEEWYREHVMKAIELLRDKRKPFFIKKELCKYLPLKQIMVTGVRGEGIPLKVMDERG